MWATYIDYCRSTDNSESTHARKELAADLCTQHAHKRIAPCFKHIKENKRRLIENDENKESSKV